MSRAAAKLRVLEATGCLPLPFADRIKNLKLNLEYAGGWSFSGDGRWGITFETFARRRFDDLRSARGIAMDTLNARHRHDRDRYRDVCAELAPVIRQLRIMTRQAHAELRKLSSLNDKDPRDDWRAARARQLHTGICDECYFNIHRRLEYFSLQKRLRIKRWQTERNREFRAKLDGASTAK